MNDEPVVIRPWADVERDAIIEAVRAKKSVLDAADALGVGKTTVYRKLRQYGVSIGTNGSVLPHPAIRAAVPPVPRFLLLPSTAKELALADLKCPKCNAVLVLSGDQKVVR